MRFLNSTHLPVTTDMDTADIGCPPILADQDNSAEYVVDLNADQPVQVFLRDGAPNLPKDNASLAEHGAPLAHGNSTSLTHDDVAPLPHEYGAPLRHQHSAPLTREHAGQVLHDRVHSCTFQDNSPASSHHEDILSTLRPRSKSSLLRDATIEPSTDWRTFDGYVFENLVMSGGGSKGYAYIGALKVNATGLIYSHEPNIF